MAVKVYTNPETGYSAWDVPGWCYYYPSILTNLLTDVCAPPTPAQIAETTKSNMGAAAASNPSVAAQIDAIANAPPTDPYYCQADPEGCAAYGLSQNSPTCAAVFGTGSTGQTLCGSPFGISNVWLIAGGALVVLLLLRR